MEVEVDILPDSHGAATQHLLLILRKTRRSGRAEMEEVVLEARHAG
jgi:hypothetical protein